MDPLMVYAEVQKMGFKTLVYDYKRVKEGEAGIEYWKVTDTKTKVVRKWRVRSYVRISELNAVDAAERRRVRRLRDKQNYVRISELNAVDAAERRRVKRLYYDANKDAIRKKRNEPANKEALKKKRDAPEAKEAAKQYNAGRKALAKKKRKYVPTSQLSAVEAEERKRKAKRGQSPAAVEAKRRRNHKFRQDKREAAHTKNKMKGEFVREVYVPKELTSCS
jgi:hypothetical protein